MDYPSLTIGRFYRQVVSILLFAIIVLPLLFVPVHSATGQEPVPPSPLDLQTNSIDSVATFDDQSGSINYYPSWSGWSHWTGVSNAMWNTVSFTGEAGREAYLSNFHGKNVTYFFSMANNRGEAEILIDGDVRGTIWARTGETRRQVGKPFTVPNGYHTIIIRPVGGGASFLTDIDAIATDIATVGPNKYDNTHSQFRFYSQWQSVSGVSGAYNGTLHWSNIPGDLMRFTFYGDTATLYYSTAPNRGIAAISIDGCDYGYVDMFSTTIRRQQSVSFTNLGVGLHVINVMVSGMRNTQSSDYFVDVDALNVSMPSPARANNFQYTYEDGVGSYDAAVAARDYQNLVGYHATYGTDIGADPVKSFLQRDAIWSYYGHANYNLIAPYNGTSREYIYNYHVKELNLPALKVAVFYGCYTGDGSDSIAAAPVKVGAASSLGFRNMVYLGGGATTGPPYTWSDNFWWYMRNGYSINDAASYTVNDFIQDHGWAKGVDSFQIFGDYNQKITPAGYRLYY